MLTLLFKLVESGLIPDPLVRMGIRNRNVARLKLEAASNPGVAKYAEILKSTPIATHTASANEQHYELPPGFFDLVLGPRRKYSSCLFTHPNAALPQAEDAALSASCDHAELSDGQTILEIGCGWGSLTLWMAENYPNSKIHSFSNSKPQRDYIRAKLNERGLSNVQVETADMNSFDPEQFGWPKGSFDRIVSIEALEHMKNYHDVFERFSQWLNDDGKAFIHIFVHKDKPYPFVAESDDDWMAKYFFAGGHMPARDLFDHFNQHMIVEQKWDWNGCDYGKTARAWLENQDANKAKIMPIMVDVYGRTDAAKWYQRWRIFFMAVEELFNHAGGSEWFVTHYRLTKSGN